MAKKTDKKVEKKNTKVVAKKVNTKKEMPEKIKKEVEEVVEKVSTKVDEVKTTVGKKKNHTFTIVTLACVCVFFVLSFIIKSAEKPNELQEIDLTDLSKEVKTWYEDLAAGNTVVTVIASSECPHCKELKPVITKSAKDNNYKLYFFEVNEMEDADYTALTTAFDLKNYEGSIPYIYVAKNKLFVSDHTGNLPDADLTTFLKDAGVIE